MESIGNVKQAFSPKERLNLAFLSLQTVEPELINSFGRFPVASKEKKIWTSIANQTGAALNQEKHPASCSTNQSTSTSWKTTKWSRYLHLLPGQELTRFKWPRWSHDFTVLWKPTPCALQLAKVAKPITVLWAWRWRVFVSKGRDRCWESPVTIMAWGPEINLAQEREWRPKKTQEINLARKSIVAIQLGPPRNLPAP